MKNPRIAIVGITGLVGRTMLTVLQERNFPCQSLRGFASSRSAGMDVPFQNDYIMVEELNDNSFDDIDIALFSAGSAISSKFAPIAAEKGCIVIDNSSCWRQDANVPLVVPEVNSYDLKWHKNIIANPNCSTIQLVLPLKALDEKYGLERVVCSTYQSISGAGQSGIDKLHFEMSGIDNLDKHKIAYNIMFHTANDDSGMTNEEQKMVFETRKILNLPNLRSSFTCTRLPILGGHCESVNIELKNDFDLEELKAVLSSFENIILIDDIKNEVYATPAISEGKDEVFISRIRRDNSIKNGISIWVVADNLRKGAATNAVQIAEKLINE